MTEREERLNGPRLRGVLEERTDKGRRRLASKKKRKKAKRVVGDRRGPPGGNQTWELGEEPRNGGPVPRENYNLWGATGGENNQEALLRGRKVNGRGKR